MPLYLWNGELLTVGGELATHEDCCCGELCPCCNGLVRGAYMTITGVVNGDCGNDICSLVDGVYDVPASTSTSCVGLKNFDFEGVCDGSGLGFRLTCHWEVACTTIPAKVWLQGYVGEVNSGGIEFDQTTNLFDREQDCLDLTELTGVPYSIGATPLCDFSSATVLVELY